MLRSALLAVALLIPGTMQAWQDTAGSSGQQTAAQTPETGAGQRAVGRQSFAAGYAATDAAPAAGARVEVCSDSERGFPPCGIPKADKRKARALYEQGLKLARRQQFDEALMKLKAARAISPLDVVYQTVEKALAEKVVATELTKGNQAMQQGDTKAALEMFRHAVEIDPSNEYAEQRLRDVLPAPEEFSPMMLRMGMGETRLQPKEGVQDFEYRGPSTGALEKFGSMFGISTITDQSGVTARDVRIKLDGVDWETGSQIVQRLCKVMMVPLSEHQVLLANDTEENRRDLTRMSLRTFYAQGGSTPAELTELVTALRVMFELRFITPNASAGTIVIRAPQSTLDAVARFLDDIRDDEPSVMLEVKVFEVSTTFSKDLGTSVPNDFTVFNIPSELNSLVSSSTYQQIVAALTASGQTVNATTILAALLASASSSSSGTANPLSQPFGVFGGGQTLTGVTVPTTSLHFSNTNSIARSMDDVLLRAEHGKAATMKVGERYPIVSSTFAATSAASSLLASIGLSSTASSTTVPTPQFTYEDLGLVLKAMPKVQGKLISLDYELTVRALGATQSNGLPLLTNREVKGTISTEDGEQVVIAGLLDKEETAAINGIPVLSAIPVLGKAFSVETKENDADELLIVMRPVITSGRRRQGVYVPVPMNVPK
jgi:type II secretory pathway component GspD/PulD (secretin)